MFRLAMVLAISSLTHFGVSALHADDAAKRDAKLLEGRWRLESVEADGKPMELGDNGPRWLIKGGKIQYAGDPLAEITIDASASPKSIDLAWSQPKRTYEGVYVLDGDTLKICVNRETDGVKERPQDLKTDGKANLRLLVFKRDKAESSGPLEGVNGFVGIMIKADGDKKTVVIDGTLPGSPADKAGLKKDDILISVAGTEATDLQTVVRQVRSQKPGHDLTFKFKRDGKEKEITFKVGKMPFYYLE